MVRAGDFHGTTGRRSTAEPSLQRGEPSAAAPSAAEMLAPSAAEMQLSGLRESPAPPNPSKRRASTAPPTAAEMRASGHVTVAHSLRGKLVLPCADVATVGQLKAQVADRLGLDLDNLALFHRSKALRDDDDAVDAGMRFYAAYCSPASRGRGGRYYAYCAWCPGWTVRNPARLALISLIEQRWFDPLVLGLILLNVAFMCFTSPVADPTEASLTGYVTAATPVVEVRFTPRKVSHSHRAIPPFTPRAIPPVHSSSSTSRSRSRWSSSSPRRGSSSSSSRTFGTGGTGSTPSSSAARGSRTALRTPTTLSASR